jgi:GNAT superfamily N-acetyltransferase
MDIQRLNERQRAALLIHFLALPVKDRSMRFGTALAPSALAGYVDRIDFCHGAVFGVQDDGSMLVGVAHVAFEDDIAEVGLSVLPNHRRRGFGTALFARAVAHARNSCISRLIMHFLWSNAPIMRIARRFRMNVVASAGDATAKLDLPAGERVD